MANFSLTFIIILRYDNAMENEEGQKEVVIHPVSFSSLKKEAVISAQGVVSPEGKIELWEDTSVAITVEIGRKISLTKDILDMKEGSIIELDKLTSEAFNILANGKIIARGQVVTTGDMLGIRVTEMVDE